MKAVREGTQTALCILICRVLNQGAAVTQQMKDIFTGGGGFCLWLLWNAVTGEKHNGMTRKRVDSGRRPIGGIIQYPGSGKTTVVTLSPLTHNVYDSNAAASWAISQFSGWDALGIQGKANEDVILFIDGDTGLCRSNRW